MVLVNANDTGFSYLYGVSNIRFKIVSATSTQIKFVTDSLFQISPGLPQTVAVYVRSPKKSGFTKNILTFKRNLTFGVTAYDPGPNPTSSLGTEVSYIFRIGNATSGTIIGFGVAFTIFP